MVPDRNFSLESIIFYAQKLFLIPYYYYYYVVETSFFSYKKTNNFCLKKDKMQNIE